MKRFTITTLGCKVNQFESDALAARFEADGWVRVGDEGEADLIVVNTCAVTGKAAMQARQAIRKVVKKSPNARIAVTGCYAQTGGEEIEAIAGVHHIVGHAQKHRINEIVAAAPPGAAAAKSAISPVSDPENPVAFPAYAAMRVDSRTRPFLKIQDGCNAFCTYCIVPHARGRSRSMPVEDVLNHIRHLAGTGCREIVLTGIHLGCYGADHDPASSLLGLTRRIAALAPAPRIRLSSIEPRELSPELVDQVGSSDQFCPHFHIPLQSGDDAILKKMHRPYTRRYFEDLVMSIHARMPRAAIGADLLIGFPGESDSAFENSRRLIESLPVSYLHVFPFSPRPGTPASRYPDPVRDGVIKERCRIMRRLGERKKRAFYRRFIGRSLHVLIEDKPDSASGRPKGFSENYIPVQLPRGSVPTNTIVSARIETVSDRAVVSGVPEDADSKGDLD